MVYQVRTETENVKIKEEKIIRLRTEDDSRWKMNKQVGHMYISSKS